MPSKEEAEAEKRKRVRAVCVFDIFIWFHFIPSRAILVFFWRGWGGDLRDATHDLTNARVSMPQIHGFVNAQGRVGY